jgi:hypothetical protein
MNIIKTCQVGFNKRFQSSVNPCPSLLRIIYSTISKQSVLIRKVSKLPPDCTLSHSRRQQPSIFGLWFSGFQYSSHHNLYCGSPGSNTTAGTVGAVIHRVPRQLPSQLGLRTSRFQHNSRLRPHLLPEDGDTKHLPKLGTPTKTTRCHEPEYCTFNRQSVTLSAPVCTRQHVLLFAHELYRRI